MKAPSFLFLILMLFISDSCVKQYIPVIEEDQVMLVAEGTITDQSRTFTISLSKSKPLWKKAQSIPLKKCLVWISDDLGKKDTLKESKPGIYLTDSLRFRAAIGREYTLHINTTAELGGRRYESVPVRMKDVPPVDSIYYEKRDFTIDGEHREGCQIFLDTHDPLNKCRFYRWSFEETWEFRIPYEQAVNQICWITGKSDEILIKNTSALSEDKVTKYPVFLISDPIDRLTVKYSILVNQFSLSEEEHLYWENLRNALDEVGGLYDIVPANIPNNLFCIDDPGEKALGYFSVSAVKSKRIFIEDSFVGINHLYDNCPSETRYGTAEIPYLNILFWILYYGFDSEPPYAPYRVLTDKKACADCTTRGSAIRPSFWK